MAATIDAPPSRVWPWLVQMGVDRAGWYSWDWLDNWRRPSAKSIQPQWQQLTVGQHLSSHPAGKFWFQVAALEPERFLALRAAFTRDGRPYDPAGPRPASFTDSLWAFQLKESPGGRTRLVVSTYGAAKPRWLAALSSSLFWEPAHWIMQARQFTNLKRRVEGRVLTQPLAST